MSHPCSAGGAATNTRNTFKDNGATDNVQAETGSAGFQTSRSTKATPAAEPIDYKGDWLAACEPEEHTADTRPTLIGNLQAETSPSTSQATAATEPIDYKGDWLAAWEPGYHQEKQAPTPAAGFCQPFRPGRLPSNAYLSGRQRTSQRWGGPRTPPQRSGQRYY